MEETVTIAWCIPWGGSQQASKEARVIHLS